ncbi:hypothetical protein HHI36_023668 [Cryptolaemus montrouzieri]|uniref:Uncharacterized protein n=1 Tax=Cryptolaemus montrouzieri TaxID=559131 RepID=A0ABD2PHA2_9CUCU
MYPAMNHNSLSYQQKTQNTYSSYSFVLKHSQVNKPGLILRSKSSNVVADNFDILKDVRKHIDPVENNLRINGDRKIKGGLIMDCDGDESMNKLSDCVHNILGSKCSVEPIKKFNPRIIVRNVELDEQNDNQLLQRNFSLNELSNDFILLSMI